MTSIICDACKKTVTNAVRGQNFHTILDKSLCLDCGAAVESVVRERMTDNDTYQLDDYKVVLRSVLAEKCR